MAGVGWGAPTEFGHKGEIIPSDKVPEWVPKMVNVFGQDDLYVENDIPTHIRRIWF